MTGNNGLPQGWITTPLNTIGDFFTGVTYKKADSSKEPREGYLPVLRANNINEKLNFDALVYVPKEKVKQGQLIQKNDIVICMSSGSKHLVGKAAQAETEFEGGFGAFCGLFRCYEDVEPKFVGYFFQSDQYRHTVSEVSRGININNLRRDHIESMEITLPPRPEQERIVAKLEETFTQLEAGVAELRNAKAQLKRYRAAVLKSAVEGELTREWREAGGRKARPDNAEKLLARILSERREKWEAEGGKGKYNEPVSPEIEDLPELPDGWTWATVEQLSAHEPNSITDGPFGSKLKTAHYTNDGPRVIRLQNIGNGVFYDEKAHISKEHFGTLRKHEVFAGDLVIGALGATLPRACIIPDYVGLAIVKADCMRFKPHPDVADTRYLNAALNSKVVQKIAKSKVHGIGRPRLNQAEVKSLHIPLPSLEEQK